LETQSDDQGHYELKEKRNSSRLSKRWVEAALFVCIAFATLLMALEVLARQQPTPVDYSWSAVHSSCGTNPAEARARNCSFDILSFAWQTPECYDEPLLSDFLSYDLTDGPTGWTFWTEPNRNVSISRETVMAGEIDAFVTWRYHIVHCTFMWRQMHRAFERGWIDSHSRNYNHTLHCQNTLLEKDIPDELVTVWGHVIYPVCEKVSLERGKSVRG